MRSLAVQVTLLCLLLTGCSDRSVSVDELDKLSELRDARVVVDPQVHDEEVGRSDQVGAGPGDSRQPT